MGVKVGAGMREARVRVRLGLNRIEGVRKGIENNTWGMGLKMWVEMNLGKS